jgi:hypothetical protein
MPTLSERWPPRFASAAIRWARASISLSRNGPQGQGATERATLVGIESAVFITVIRHHAPGPARNSLRPTGASAIAEMNVKCV